MTRTTVLFLAVFAAACGGASASEPGAATAATPPAPSATATATAVIKPDQAGATVSPDGKEG